jgi:hypothetical protein
MATTQSGFLSTSSILYSSIEDTKSNVHKNEQLESEWLPPFECHQVWSLRGHLVELLGGLLGEVVFDFRSLVHPPFLDQLHLPIG